MLLAQLGGLNREQAVGQRNCFCRRDDSGRTHDAGALLADQRDRDGAAADRSGDLPMPPTTIRTEAALPAVRDAGRPPSRLPV